MEGEEAIVLIGFMGAGKTSVGRELARRTLWPLYETDALVEARLDLSISDFFASHGEGEFRNAETEALREMQPRRAIVATGGGTVLRPENVEMLRGLGRVVYLEADEATLIQRLSSETESRRPLLQGSDLAGTLSRLLKEREPLYRTTANFTVDTSALSVAEVAEKILQHVG
ncbi:MAG: shikimate kinase [Chthoniobacterales bacterium]